MAHFMIQVRSTIKVMQYPFKTQTKAVGTQMPKVHEADKIVDPAPRPKTQDGREGIV